MYFHPVVVANYLICSVNLGGATSCRVPRLLMCQVAVFNKCYVYSVFRPYKIIIR
jgi:hypothetical protein